MLRLLARISGLAVLLIGGATSSNAAPTDLSKRVLTADSPTALVIIKTQWWPPTPPMKSTFRLTLSAYDPIAGKLLGAPFSGGALFQAQTKKFTEGYLIESIKPGQWVFMSYSQQDLWALCFNAHSLQFEVKPGEVVYLGEFDALSHRRQLTEHAIRSGKTSISGYGFADFFDLPEGPQFKPIADSDLTEVQAMLSRNAPQITAPIRRADYTPAQFGTGSTLFAERRCGGYFSTRAKKDKHSE